MDITAYEQKEILKCIGEKNPCGITAVCGEKGDNLKKLVSAYGTLEAVLPVLREIYGETLSESASQLVKLVSALEDSGFKNMIHIDFSVLNDMSYYNGIVFRGFINGIPMGILSGGQYDRLMSKMGKRSKAIGFAVYLDMLERLNETEKEYDVDTVILYDENSDLNDIKKAVDMVTSGGKSTAALKSVPEKLKYKQLLKLHEKGVLIIENNA